MIFAKPVKGKVICDMCGKDITEDSNDRSKSEVPWMSDGSPFCDKECQSEKWKECIKESCTECREKKCEAKQQLDYAVFLMYRALAEACKRSKPDRG